MTMSEETYCFSADVYVNGKKSFAVENRGHGGCDSFYPYGEEGKKILKEVEAWAKTLPPIPFPESGDPDRTLETDIEIVIGELVEQKLLEKDVSKLQKGMTQKTFFMTKDDVLENPASQRFVKAPYDDKVKSYLDNKYGLDNILILNDLSRGDLERYLSDVSKNKSDFYEALKSQDSDDNDRSLSM